MESEFGVCRNSEIEAVLKRWQGGDQPSCASDVHRRGTQELRSGAGVEASAQPACQKKNVVTKCNENCYSLWYLVAIPGLVGLQLSMDGAFLPKS